MEQTMNTTATHPTTQPLLTAGARFGIAAAVAVVLAIAWGSAERESRDAVLVAGTAMKAQAVHITLPSVEIVGRRAARGKIAA